MWENRLSRKCENFCPWEFFFSCKVKILCVYTNYFVLVDDCAEWFLRADSAKHPFGGKSSAAAGETPSVPSAPPGCTASAPRGALSITWSWLPAASKLFPGQVPHAPRPSRGPGRLSSNTPGSPDGCVWEFPSKPGCGQALAFFVSLVSDQPLPAWVCILCVPRATIRLTSDSRTRLQQVQRGPPCLLALLFEIIVTFYINPFFFRIP